MNDSVGVCQQKKGGRLLIETAVERLRNEV